MNNEFIGMISKENNCDFKILKKYDYKCKLKNNTVFINSKNILIRDNVLVILNGFIYNEEDLKIILNTNNSKNELILDGYKKFGIKIFEKLNGSYSCIICDEKTNDLYIVRDKIGTKSIYYKCDNENLYFSSSLRNLVNNFDINKNINSNVLENYLSFQYSVLDDTFYTNCKKLMPGNILHYNNGNMNLIEYYKLTFTHDNIKTQNELSEDIYRNCKNIIKKYENNSSNITTFLSSGVDSSFIASLSSKSKDTYTIGFDNLQDNEAKYSYELSEKLNKNNIILNIDADTYFGAIKEISSFIEEPLADPSSVGMFLLCKEASKKYDTVLIGEGPDEFFAGYNVYKEPFELTVYNKVPFFIRKIISNIMKMFPKIRGINFLVRRGQKVEEWYIGNANIFSYKERKKILKSSNKTLKPQEITKKYYSEVKDEDTTSKMQYIDMRLWLAGDELFNAEMMGKHNNIKLMTPFLNQELIDIALSLETSDKINKYNTKLIFRTAAQHTLEEKWYNKKKLGFPIPLRAWLKEDKYYNLVLEIFKSSTANKYFNTNKIIKLLDEHKQGKKDNSRKIWTVYVFILWYQTNIGEENE